MSHRALTEDQVKEFKKCGLTDDMIKQMDDNERDKLDKKVGALTLTKKGKLTSGPKELRLVLWGKTGAGKSSLGNLITGRSTFKECPGTQGCTKTVCTESCEVDGIHIQVIDTPGLFDPEETIKNTLCEMAKITDRFSDGIHGYLFVFNAGNPRFTEEERKTFDLMMKELLGPEFLEHCFLIITNGYNILEHKSLREYLESETGTAFGSLLTQIGPTKVIAAENLEKTKYGRTEQQQQIVRMIAENVRGVYTNEAQKKYQEEKRKTAEKLNADVRSLAPAIEEALSDELDRRAWHDIVMMSGTMKDVIVESVLAKVRQRADSYVADEKLREAIHIVLKDKIWRFTAKVMLGAVAGSVLVVVGAVMFAAAGPATVLTAITETLCETVPPVIGAFLRSILKR